MQTAKSIYEDFVSDNEETSVGDGTVIDISKENIQVPSFNPNSLKIENKKMTHVWKLEGKKMYEVFIDAGNNHSVRVTPEHPFFIMRAGMLIQARADQLHLDDYIAVPRTFKTQSKKVDLLSLLRNIDLNIHLSKERIPGIISQEFKTIKQAALTLEPKRNYAKFTMALKKGLIPLSFVHDAELPSQSLGIKRFKFFKLITFPRYLSEDLAEFLGYVIGDGHITHKTVEIVNADEELIKRFIILSQKIFGLTPNIVKYKRSRAQRILLSSVTLADIFHTVFDIPYGKKGKSLGIPQVLFSTSNTILSHFIRAYIDCDGHITKNYRNIEVSSESQILLKQLNLLLRRYSIFSTLSRKKVKGQMYWKLCIEGRYAEAYSKQFGSVIKRKSSQLSSFIEIEKAQGCGKHDMIPIGLTLKDLRESLGHSIGYIQREAVNSYGIYEKNE
ncbi:MAG: LAGLIDADG family homing endonuclease, partial [Candidatus Thermoplasmatota archaeon]|nr:LAGLIDADG family homing endonuclease [Candidatus Thermoplasmatota archaeon]